MGWGRFFPSSNSNSFFSNNSRSSTSWNWNFSFFPVSSWYNPWFHWQHVHHYSCGSYHAPFFPNSIQYWGNCPEHIPRSLVTRFYSGFSNFFGKCFIGLILWVGLCYLSYILPPLDNITGLLIGTIFSIAFPLCLPPLSYSCWEVDPQDANPQRGQ